MLYLPSCSDGNDEPDEPKSVIPDDKPIDDMRIIGTWQASVDGVTYTISFSGNGVMHEKTNYDSANCRFTFKNSRLDFAVDLPAFANELGEPPFRVQFGSGTQPGWMDITCGSHSITFYRTTDSPSHDEEYASDYDGIYGTWSCYIDDQTYTITFSENGIMMETTRHDSVECRYTFKNGKLDFGSDLPAFANELGDPPFNVTFGQGKRPEWMRIQCGSHSLTFYREGSGSPIDDHRIHGKWEATYEGKKYTLFFFEDGVMREITKYDTIECHYTLKNGKLDFGEDLPSFANELGDPPFNITFQTGTNPNWIKISGERYSITFNKK